MVCLGILLLLLVAIAGGDNGLTVPLGFTHLGTAGLESRQTKGLTDYFLSNEAVEWTTAFVRCPESMLNGNLLAIRSEAEMTTVRNAILANMPLPATVWTSGVNDGLNWVWAIQEELSIPPQWWGAGFPGAPTEFVDLHVRGPLNSQRTLRTSNASNRARYICEAIRDTNPTTIPPTTTDTTTTTAPENPKCGELLEDKSGEIVHKPSVYYDQNEICTWLVTSPPYNVVKFKVLEEGMTAYAKISIYSPSDYGDMQYLQKIYAGDSKTYEYTGYVFIIIFTSGKSNNGQNDGTGFRLAYDFVNTTSNQRYDLKSYYFHPDPRDEALEAKFPPNENLYAPNTLYTAVYSAPLDYQLSFQTTTYMDIEPKCNNDKLMFYYYDTSFDLYFRVRICNGERGSWAMGTEPFIFTLRTNEAVEGSAFSYISYIYQLNIISNGSL